ncbi:MAG TPA: hypothetical protein VF189_04280 [Patescibacteria group bacterium]
MARETLNQLVRNRNEADRKADYYCDIDDWQASQRYDVERIDLEKKIDRRVNGVLSWKKALRTVFRRPQPQLY